MVNESDGWLSDSAVWANATLGNTGRDGHSISPVLSVWAKTTELEVWPKLKKGEDTENEESKEIDRMKIEIKSKILLAWDKLPFTCNVVYINLISKNYVKYI